MNENIWKKKCIISPSLISCFDMCNLERDVRIMEDAGVEVLHIDILDGHFSPSMPLGLDAVRQLRKITNMVFDVHLMSHNNQYFVEELLDIGVEQIVFHLETEEHIDGLLNLIHSKGVRAGVALKPATPIQTLEYVLDKCDAVLLMLINPGYASSSAEKQVSYAERKILDLRNMINLQQADIVVELDGRISVQNLADYGNGAADLFVAGSTCIKKLDLKESIKTLFITREQIIS